MLQFKLKHLVAVVTFVALYFGLLAGTARLVGVSSPFAFSLWANELFRWPLYVLWFAVAVIVFERRSENPLSAKLAVVSLIGFIALSMLNAILQVWMMASIQSGGARSFPTVFWMGWSIVSGLLHFTYWVLLSVALVKAMKRPSKPLDESHAVGTQSV